MATTLFEDPTTTSKRSFRRVGVGALVVLIASTLAAATSIADTLCTACIDTGSDEGAELVIASPGEDRGADVDAGLAHLLVDGTTAITLGEGRDLGDATINGTPEDDDMFASALAAADFNGDGFDDIAIGIPLEDVGSVDDAGVVIVLLSDAETGALNESIVLKQGSNGFPGSPDEGDNFGFSLSSQDFGFNDGFDDLIIGVPGEDIDGAADAGQVHVVMGSADGPDPTDVETWHQDVAGINGGPEAGDRWGHSVAGSSVGDESWGTLIVGAPFEDIGDIVDAGIVQVIYSESSGLTSSGDQIWHQDSDDIRGNAEAGDHFGMTLAVGDFGSGYDDLAVGVPGEDTGSTVDAGIVQIINGDFNGLVASGNSVIKQGAGQIDGNREANDRFGAALATVPVGSDDVLVIGAPGETLGGNASAGSVHLRFPMAEDAIGIVTIHQNKPGVKGSNEAGDEFGFAIDYGDVDNDGNVDLIIGGPGEDDDAGKVWVFYGSVEGFSGDDDTFRQGRGAFGGAKEAGDRFGAVVLGSRR